jgi:hypothetical protein
MTSLLSFILIFIVASGTTLAAPTITKSSEKPKTAAITKRKPAKKGLIPPPPPAVPFGGQFLFMGGPSFMSLNDVKKRREQLCAEVIEAKKSLEDTDKRLAERKDRSKLFETLYKEGVVSKRELEGAQDSVNQSSHELEQDKLKLNGLQQELDQIDAFLKQQKKSFSILYMSPPVASNLVKDFIKTR